jgi:hypothetical protein
MIKISSTPEVTRRVFLRTTAAAATVPGPQPLSLFTDVLLGGGCGLLPGARQQLVALCRKGGAYDAFLQQLGSLNGATTLQELALGAEQCARAGNAIALTLGRLVSSPAIRETLDGFWSAHNQNNTDGAVKLLEGLCDGAGDPYAACRLLELDGLLPSSSAVGEQVLAARSKLEEIVTQRTVESARRLLPADRAQEFIEDELPRRLADAKLSDEAKRRGQLLEGLGRSLASQIGQDGKLHELKLPNPLQYLVSEVRRSEVIGQFAHYEFLRIPERVSP